MKYLQIHLYNIEKLKINSIIKGVIQIMFISNSTFAVRIIE